ncbi:MAG TPA: hypothetical protein VKR61_22000 [Bryobacteraceae bacterium]|nr:hypothetical protein [Bryobacteraceae bacterium]
MLGLLVAQEGPKRSVEAAKTERVAFMPGGTVRVENSYGYLTVEGWDEPAVEIAVTRSTDNFYKPGEKAQAMDRLDRVHVADKQQSGKELTVTTSPARQRLLIVSWPFPRKRGVTAEYVIHVPRDSHLEINHDNGYVWVSDVKGDIQVHSHTGDMIVMLPDPGSYSIDAGARMGSVSSDFIGKGHRYWPAGAHFTYTGPAATRRVSLRMGRGCIAILNGPASGPFWKD